MDHAALVTFFHWFLLALMVAMFIVVVMAISALGHSTDSYDSDVTPGGGH